LRITKAVSLTSVLLSSSSCVFSSRCHTLTSFLSTFVFFSRSQPHHIQSWDFEPVRNQADQQEAGATRNKKGYIDLTTQKSGSIFTTRTLRELSDQYLDLQKKYETLQNSLVKKVVEIAGMSLSLDPSLPSTRKEAGSVLMNSDILPTIRNSGWVDSCY
jgi:hypothetical protein